MSTCHHVNEPPEISNKGSIKKDKSELFVWAPDLAPALISNYFPSVLLSAHCGHSYRWRHPQVPIRGLSDSFPSNTQEAVSGTGM